MFAGSSAQSALGLALRARHWQARPVSQSQRCTNFKGPSLVNKVSLRKIHGRHDVFGLGKSGLRALLTLHVTTGTPDTCLRSCGEWENGGGSAYWFGYVCGAVGSIVCG